MRSFDTLVSIVAGIVVLIAVALVGVYIGPSTVLPPAGPSHDGAVCEDEPLLPVAETVITGLTQLCVTEHGIRAWVELVGLRNDALYTGWLVYGSRPLSAQGLRCGQPDEHADAMRRTPLRIDGTIANATGRAQFTVSYPEIRLTGKDDVWMLVVDHGVLPPDDQSTMVWKPGWWGPSTATGADTSVVGRLTGCAHFRRRGGVDSLELDRV